MTAHTQAKRELIARTIWNVASETLAPQFAKAGIPQTLFENGRLQDRDLHFRYADAVLAALDHGTIQTPSARDLLKRTDGYLDELADYGYINYTGRQLWKDIRSFLDTPVAVADK